MIPYEIPIAPTGARTVVNVQTASESAPTIVELLAWETKSKKPENVELVLWPQHWGDAALTNLPTRYPTFTTTRVDLRVSVGTERGGAELGTAVHDGNFYNNNPWPYAWLPDHGMRLRLTCRSLRLRLKIVGGPVSYIACAAVTPSGPAPRTDVIPAVVNLGYTYPPHPIPIGATEFKMHPIPRDSSGNHDPTMSVRFVESCGTPVDSPQFSKSLLSPTQKALEMSVGAAVDWIALPGEAWAMMLTSNGFSTALFR